jgi:hypothetical protein
MTAAFSFSQLKLISLNIDFVTCLAEALTLLHHILFAHYRDYTGFHLTVGSKCLLKVLLDFL